MAGGEPVAVAAQVFESCLSVGAVVVVVVVVVVGGDGGVGQVDGYELLHGHKDKKVSGTILTHQHQHPLNRFDERHQY